ncbi:MAG TPA: permease [Rhodobacteraceae bacterium]|nr:permease [Paracoccaceae bacterium]
MNAYLPIAEISASVPMLVGLGLGVGILSGLFGVGGGFILTPLLFMIGIPPAIAVGTQGNLIVGSSVSGVLTHLRRGTVDFAMGFALLAGGLTGSFFGVKVFHWLTSLGQIDLVIKLAYVLLLGTIGGLMAIEAVRAIRARSQGKKIGLGRKHHSWMQGLPFRMRFRASGLYISAIPPVLVGVLVGVMAAIMGVGGGFIMVPAMIYLLNMPTKTVIGTSLFQITFLAGFTTLMQAIENQTVDFVLAIVLLVGGVVGAQIGSRLGQRLNADTLRLLLAAMVLLVSVKIGLELAFPPADAYSVMTR